MMKTILLDLDDTILDFHRSEAEAIALTLRQLNLEPTTALIERYSEINDGLWKQLERGEVTREVLLCRRFEQLFAECGITAHSGTEAQRIYEYQLSQQVHFVDGAQALLDRLAGEYNLYIVSNGTAVVQDSRIHKAGLERYFKKIFISQRIGYNKPHPAFFQHCFAQIPDMNPAQTVIVGDSLSSDIAGGIAAGIHTCWFNPLEKPRPAEMRIDYEIRRLAQLPAIWDT